MNGCSGFTESAAHEGTVLLFPRGSRTSLLDARGVVESRLRRDGPATGVALAPEAGVSRLVRLLSDPRPCPEGERPRPRPLLRSECVTS